MDKFLIATGVLLIILFIIFGLRELIASAVLKALEEFEIIKEKNKEFKDTLDEFGPFKEDTKKKKG